MSMIRLVLPTLCWAELSQIISYLSLRELWVLGCCNRSAFITFLRERSLRKCKDYDKIPVRFLSKLSNHEKVALVSYPRSGNSFVRKLIENSTCIVTGSDNRPNRTLSAHLLEYGYLGEAITDNSVWVVKSHYPERLGYVRFPVARVVLVIRNPFDAIESYFHMGMTNTHDKALTREVFLSLRDTWVKFVENEARIWVEFHKFWLNKRSEASILMVRYEDLMQDSEGVMRKVQAFMEQGKTPFALHRFKKLATAVAEHKSAGYEPKKVKKFGKGLDIMSPEDRQLVALKCGKLMKIFGYQVQLEPDPTSLDGGSVISHLEVLPWSDTSLLCPLPDSHGVAQDALSASIFEFLSSSTTTTTPAGAEKTADSARTSTAADSHSAGSSTGGELFMNDYFTLRGKVDLFGRNITDLRKSMTKNDTEPFATV